ncbi:unnamed protein product, partial [Iphiclides podalirius]
MKQSSYHYQLTVVEQLSRSCSSTNSRDKNNKSPLDVLEIESCFERSPSPPLRPRPTKQDATKQAKSPLGNTSA